MHCKVDLAFPIERDGSIVRTVLIRRPTADDIALVAPGWRPGDRAPENLVEAVLAMVARLTDLPPDLVDELDAFDIERLSEMLGGFSNLEEQGE